MEDWYNRQNQTTYGNDLTKPKQTKAPTAAPTPAPTVATPVVTTDPSSLATTNKEAQEAPHSVGASQRRWLSMDEIVAQSYVVVDLSSGAEVLSENGTLPLEVAGLSRLMALYTVLNDPSFDPNRGFELGDLVGDEQLFEANEAISTETAVFAMFYEASETAARALVNTYGPGTEAFLQKMQQNAAQLGMAETEYVDPLGVERGGTTTANDTVKLIRALQSTEAFRALSEKATYLLPNGNKYQLTGLAEIENPAAMIDSMSSDYLLALKGLQLTEGSDGWSYGSGSAETNDGRNLLAIVLGATSKVETVQGEQRAAQVLRTLLEAGAKQLGVSPVDNRSLLALKSKSEQKVQQVQNVTPVETIATVAQVQATTTEAMPLTALSEDTEKKEGLGLLFYVVLGVLVLTVLALIALFILNLRKRRMQRARPRRAVRPAPQPRYYR